MSIFDKENPFLRDINNDSNFRILLALALEETRGSVHPVIEFGPSEGSTPFLHAYCEDEKRRLVSVEENIGAIFPFMQYKTDRHDVSCMSWDCAPIEGNLFSVALLDHAPGTRRWADVMRLKSRCEIIVLHDTEPAQDHGYQFSQIWGEFKYRVDVKTGGAWASAVSNSRDLRKWRGAQFGPYVVSSGEDDVKTDPVQEAVQRFLNTPIEDQP